jgi:threonine dehydrogenase-like Zn-dependent dehydrogenase
MRQGALVVDDVDDPTPGPSQLLVRTLACGICGSDLHALAHGSELVALYSEMTLGDDSLRPAPMDLDRDIVMGHEFCAEVVETGPATWNCSAGDVVVSMPMTLDERGLHPIGYANDYPGGFAELMVLSDPLALKVPNGVDPQLAALTEPMAVGRHAVALSSIRPGEAAVVLGCGPVGLAVIADLRRLGIEPIIGADFSPLRRRLAHTMGAHEVVDPRDEAAVDAWRRIDSRSATRPLVVFEAVGVPGMIDAAMLGAPRRSRVVVVGVCMQPDTIRPLLGIARELNIQFALGYDPAEFAATLLSIAEGELGVAPMVTGRVPIDEVPKAFADLSRPDTHAKVLVTPTR